MPAAPKLAHDPAVVAALESEALRRPGAYRVRLTLIAVAGDLALTATQVLPLALPILIGAFVVNLPFFYWLAGAAIAFLAWLFRPGLRVEGRAVAPAEAPRLHEEIERLRRKLDVPGRLEVRLDGAFNASALEGRGLLGVLGTRRVLTLGMPLLAVLGREDVLAVIAHELGHFSRRHGRLGHWLYRARAGWLQYVHTVGESDSSFDRAAAWYARKFVPFFSVRSFVHSRRCEYEADADGALAVGAGCFAAALARIEIYGALWARAFPRELDKCKAAQGEAPRDLHERFERFCRERPAAELRERLEEALRVPSGWQDTHPSLAERLRAVGEPPSSAAPAESAGATLFGERWRALLRAFDDDWARRAQPAWLLEHLRLQHLGAPRGLGDLAALHEANPSDFSVKFSYAAALLHAGDAAGVPLMEVVARQEPAFRLRAFADIVRYYERRGDTAQVERWSAWLEQVSKAAGEALEPLLEQAEEGKLRAGSLAGGERALLAAAARLDPCVRQAWLLGGTATLRYTASRSVLLTALVLVLTVDPAEMQRVGEDEEGLIERYQRLLETLVRGDHVPLVRTYFTTEPLPPAYGKYTPL